MTHTWNFNDNDISSNMICPKFNRALTNEIALWIAPPCNENIAIRKITKTPEERKRRNIHIKTFPPMLFLRRWKQRSRPCSRVRQSGTAESRAYEAERRPKYPNDSALDFRVRDLSTLCWDRGLPRIHGRREPVKLNRRKERERENEWIATGRDFLPAKRD